MTGTSGGHRKTLQEHLFATTLFGKPAQLSLNISALNCIVVNIKTRGDHKCSFNCHYLFSAFLFSLQLYNQKFQKHLHLLLFYLSFLLTNTFSSSWVQQPFLIERYYNWSHALGSHQATRWRFEEEHVLIFWEKLKGLLFPFSAKIWGYCFQNKVFIKQIKPRAFHLICYACILPPSLSGWLASASNVLKSSTRKKTSMRAMRLGRSPRQLPVGLWQMIWAPCNLMILWHVSVEP